MKSSVIIAFLVGILLFVSFACTTRFPGTAAGTTSKLPPEPEVLQLTAMVIPDTIEPGVPLDVVVNFKTEDEVSIRKVCFQWVSETVFKKVPSVYCYVIEAQDKLGHERACSRWLTEGAYDKVSPVKCLEPDKVTYEKNGSFHVNLSPTNIRSSYNMLECYTEYIYHGKVKWSNRVGARIRINSK